MLNMLIYKKITFFFLLAFFHIGVSLFVFLIANSGYFDHMLDEAGFWYFAGDSFLYHQEANIQLEYLKKSEWGLWFSSFPHHINVKTISLVYWLTGLNTPIVYSIINAAVWSYSVILIFKSSKLLFPQHNLIPFLTVIFFFQPSILIGSTQLLRDPIFILGICSFIFGWVSLQKENLPWKWFSYMLIGFIFTISMREYLLPIFVSSVLIYMVWGVFYKKEMIAPVILLMSLIYAYSSGGLNSRITSLTENQNVEKVYTQKMGDFASNEERLKEALVNKDEALLEQIKVDKKIENLSKQLELKKSILNDAQLPSEELEKQLAYIEEENDILLQEIIESPDEELDKQLTYIQEQHVIQIEEITEVKKNADVNLLKAKNELNDKLKNNMLDQIKKERITEEVSIVKNNRFHFGILDVMSRSLGSMRYDFYMEAVVREKVDGIMINESSSIDGKVRIMGFMDYLLYVPRAFQISFLSPFPNDWLSDGNMVGKLGKALAGVEMIIWYIVLIGFIKALFSRASIFIPLIPVFFFALSIFLLLGSVVPNVGAIFRMRQGYMIPFFIFGVYGLKMLYYQWISK